MTIATIYLFGGGKREVEYGLELMEEGTPTEFRGKRSFEKRTIRLGRTFAVIVDGMGIGKVCYEMATREQRTPGRRYVNSRWQSPAWFYYNGESYRRSIDYTTRKHAVERLIEDWVNDQERSA